MPPGRIALWVATIAALAVLARSILFEPLPLWVSVSAMLAYFALATVGVLVPQLEMFGDVLWRGPSDKNWVALTFDDGPNPTTTRRVLAILDRFETKATFFLVGRKVRLHPEVVKEIHDAGHALGLHGYQHDRLFSLKRPSYVAEDIERTQRAIEEACGARPVVFRPPIGHVSARTASGAKRAGVELIAWSVRSLDGLGGDPDRVAARIEKGLRPGAIIAMHDAAENDDAAPASIEALPRVLQEIRDRELEAVTIDRMLE